MNDISLKSTECKELVDETVVPITKAAENEVDPLAFDVQDRSAEVAEILVKESPQEVENLRGYCDENAKEENICVKNHDNTESLKNHENGKEEQAKESSETMIINENKETAIVEMPRNTVETLRNILETSKLTKVTQETLPSEETQKPLSIVNTPPIALKTQQKQEANIETPAKVPTPGIEKSIVENTTYKNERVVENKTKLQESADVVMKDVLMECKKEKIDGKPLQPMNGDVAKDETAAKRRLNADIETESPLKKLCQEVEKTFPQHDSMVNDYIQTATKNNVDEIQRHTEQLLSEIHTLRELAQKKEQEWNNILHLKKVKEEILLRLLRKKQVISFEKSAEMNGSERSDPFDYLNQAKNLAIDKSDEISGLAIKQPGSTHNPIIQNPVMTTHFSPMSGLPPPYDKAHMASMPKPMYPQPLMLPGPTLPGFPRDMNGQLPTSFSLPMGRQGPTKDVKSIIADYRQRNPDLTPRRGRRMKSILNPNMMNMPRQIAPKMDGMNSLHNLNNLNMLFGNLDMNQKAMLERLQQMQVSNLANGLSFKDVLVQYANMQNTGLLPNRPPEAMNKPEHHQIRPEPRRRERTQPEETQVSVKQAERLASPSPRLPPPPPYPEISLLPVTSSQDTSSSQQSSLLHGILTKQAPPATQSYSPTLAKLLRSPERKSTLPSIGQAKNCGEITITPVQPTPPPAEATQEKPEEVVQLDDEESAASEGSLAASPSGSGSGGRLVIDEAAEAEGAEGEAAEAEGEAPLCQGCRRRDAQFVCAGCANQWYCSRDCQVAAWDEHSEMCSG